MLSWSAAGAITHNLAVGQVVVPDDVIDMTHHRSATFFEQCDLGMLRQFPVFCPRLRLALEETLVETRLPVRAGGTLAVTEGPRLETPAEVRMLAAVGAELVSHSVAPEVFLARELQMCFAGACYLVNYAETGSRHRPFSTGELFGGLTTASQVERLAQVNAGLPAILEALAERLENTADGCECHQTVAHQIARGRLDHDWHKWFNHSAPA